jgi:predicted RNA binding protein YcfA (HicA-like mRNA interferase family)
MTIGELQRLLARHGFYLAEHRHRHDYFRNEIGVMVPVPRHGKNQEVATGTLKSILKKAGIR